MGERVRSQEEKAITREVCKLYRQWVGTVLTCRVRAHPGWAWPTDPLAPPTYSLSRSRVFVVPPICVCVYVLCSACSLLCPPDMTTLHVQRVPSYEDVVSPSTSCSFFFDQPRSVAPLRCVGYPCQCRSENCVKVVSSLYKRDHCFALRKRVESEYKVG